MEIKVLIYIIGGILWFIYNNKSKLVKNEPNRNPSPIPNPVQPTLSKIETDVIKQRKVASQILASSKNQLNENRLKENQKTSKNLNSVKPKTEKNDDQVAFLVLEMEANDDYEQKSIGNMIGSDLRNGTIDLRQAMVINELLRPVYL